MRLEILVAHHVMSAGKLFPYPFSLEGFMNANVSQTSLEPQFYLERRNSFYVVYYFHPDCHMKCHKDDTEKADLIQPCVAGMFHESFCIFKINILLYNPQQNVFLVYIHIFQMISKVSKVSLSDGFI